MRTNLRSAKAQRGFSFLELLIVMALLAIVAASILLQVNTASQRSSTERVELDLFQESREFMDQLSRDLRQVGYPNQRNYANLVLNPVVGGVPTNSWKSTGDAVGLTYVSGTDLRFEGGLDDNGNVLFTQYHYDTTGAGCPCLRRSQQPLAPVSSVPTTRTNNPDLDAPVYSSEVQNVQNYADPNNPVPIFRYYTNGGTVEVVNPALEWDSTGGTNNQLAVIDAIRIELVVQSPFVDQKTGQAPSLSLVSTVKVNNCSQATSGQLSCAN